MREALLIIAILAGIGMTIRWPFVGVLLWEWFTLQNPHRETYGFVSSTNFVIAAVTILVWLLSKERKLPPNNFLLWAILAFLAWSTVTTVFAYNPEWSYIYWDRTWKTFALGLLVAVAVTNRVRLHAVLWVAVISLFYYGVKGGLFTLLTGGENRVLGPVGTMIQDNNQLAVAMLMVLPFAHYLREQMLDRRMRILMLGSMILTVFSVIGTYSRGALIGLAALGVIWLLRVKHRFLYLGAAVVLIAFTVHFMPDKYFGRMSTMNSVETVQSDASFHGRIVAWKVAYYAARDRFPFGAGFYGPQLGPFWRQYIPHEKNHAAHSIYFQVLGEHGFIGLFIYLALLAGTFWRCSRIVREARKLPDKAWLAEAGVAIQSSLIVFCVSGAALSMAYYDIFVINVCLLMPMWGMVKPKLERQPFRPVPVTASG